MRRFLIGLCVVLWASVGSAMPANTSCAAATVIGSLPYDFTESSLGGATELWWQYVTGPSETLISLVVSGNDTLTFSLSSGPNCAGLSAEFTEDLAVYIVEVVPSSPYWIRAFSFGGGLTSVRVRVSPMPSGAIVEGSLVIPNVFSGPQRATVFSPTGDVIKVVPGFPTGLGGDSLGDVALVQDDPAGDAVLYNQALTEIARLSNYFNVASGVPASIRGNLPTRTFWTGDPVSTVLTTVGTVSAAGVAGARTWALTTAATLEGLVPSRDETILYWADVASSAVHRYDLVHSVPLSDLAASLGSGWGVLRSMVVLTDNSLCISYVHPSATRASKVIRYSAAGAVLSTYDVDALDPGQYLDSIARNLPASTKIWIWVEPPGGKAANPAVPMHFKLVDMADLSVSESFNSDDFDGGAGSKHWSEPRQMWGPDSTAIFWVLASTPVPVLPPPGTQVDNSTPCCDAGGTPGSSPGANPGPVTPPISTLWYRHCTGGGEVPSAPDVVEPEDWHVEVPPKEPHGWLTIVGQADEADERWGLQPLSDRDRFVAGRLEEVGSIERRSSDKDGNYAPARMRLVANDDDGTFRERLGDPDRREVMHRESRYERSSYAARKAGLDPIPRMQGRIVDVQPGLDRKAVVELQDIVGSQFGVLDPQKTVGVPVGSEHPNLPDASKGRIYNILFGEKSDSTGGTDTSVGMMPVVDCGDGFVDTGDGATPDPEGRTFDESIVAPVDQAIVNESNTGGDIVRTTFGMVAAIVGGVIGNPSLGLVLDPDGDGAGGPAVPHTHRMVWEAAPAADEYIVWMFLVPGFHPINNPAADTNVRYKIISNVPTTPPFPPKGAGSPDSWDFYADFTSLTDGASWGVQTVGPPTNLVATVIGTPGTARKSYSVASVSIFGESAPCTPVLVTTAPDVLSATDYVHLAWGPPVDNADAVIGYRVLEAEAP